MKKSVKKVKLSIVILSLNTKDLLEKCLVSLTKVAGEVNFEVIVVDNGSTDGSIEMLRNFQFSIFNFQIIQNGENLGFAAGNNRARSIVNGEYILFLNSDTEVYKGTLAATVGYLDEHNDVGAVTCRTVLPDGRDDKDARRSFPTPWVALAHFLYLDRVFPKSGIFARYWYGYEPANKEHDIDVLQGAYCMIRTSLMNKIGWFDEDYFLDGEDIDLCWKIREAGYRIVYYPKVKILHIKGATKGKQNARKNVRLEERLRYVTRGVESMRIFYKKHLWDRYPVFVNWFMMVAIEAKKLQRIVKVYLDYLI